MKRRKATRGRRRRRGRIPHGKRSGRRTAEASLPAASPHGSVAWRPAILLFIGSLLVYNANLRLIGSGDAIPARLLPFAILNQGSLYLDTYGPPPKGSYWFYPGRKGRLVSFYPIVLPVLVTPMFLPVAIYLHDVPPGASNFRFAAEMMEKLSASTVAALSVVLMWLLLRRITSRRVALVLTLAYAFGTQTWSTSSQALWQHGLGELLLASALLLLVRPGISRTTALLLGGICALLAFNRPPDGLFAFAIAGYVWLRRRDDLPAFVTGGVLAGLPFLVYNLMMFGRPLGGYQLLLGTTEKYNVPEGIAALLVSPGKGLLVFAPFLLFLFKSPLTALGSEKRPLAIPLWVAFGAQLVFYATIDWRGGACYGPRFLTDALPFLVASLAPAVEGLRRPVGKIAFAATLAFAITVQGIGAFCFPAGGSYLLTQEQLWAPSNAPFLLEARAGLASPEFLREWGKNRRGPR